MSGADSSARSLLEMTLDRSIEARGRLSALAQALLSAKRSGLSDRDRAVMLGILGKLMDRIERRLRGGLAERLSEAAGTPHDLILALASDSAEWARPILQDSGVFSDPRLIERAYHRALEHQLTASRDLLTGESGTSAQADAIKALLDDPDSHVAQATTAYLVDQAKRSDGYQEPLVRTSELSGALLEWLCWRISGALRQHILAQQEIDWSRLDDALERATIDLIGTARERALAWRDTAAAQLARALDESGEATAALMTQLLQQGEFALFEALLGQRLQLEPPLLRQIIHSEKLADLAVACRALQVSEAEYDSLTGLLQAGRKRHTAAAEEEILHFNSIDADEAKTVLRFWQRDPAYRDAITGLRSSAALKR